MGLGPTGCIRRPVVLAGALVTSHSGLLRNLVAKRVGVENILAFYQFHQYLYYRYVDNHTLFQRTRCS